MDETITSSQFGGTRGKRLMQLAFVLAPALMNDEFVLNISNFDQCQDIIISGCLTPFIYFQ